MKLVAAGISHKTAPLALREQFAVAQADVADVARSVKLSGALDEMVLISTCNRVEIYAVTERPTNQIKSLFRLLSDEVSDLDDYVYIHGDDDAVRHLIQVAAGLDSMVLGN
jgi:glutamyl-tRNA reductase